MKVILGSSFYDADPDTMRRQARAMDATESLPQTVVVDLQWHDVPQRRPWIRSVAALRGDSTTVTGHTGRAKPIATEALDALADIAEREGARYFLYFNADIIVSADAAALLHRADADGYAFSRMDVAPDGREMGPVLSGFDAFAFEVGWWRANRQRFRPYILGEACWDNVYAAVLMCHGRGRLVNRDLLIRHEVHDTAWGDGPFAQYNSFLASLDARYFTMWATYHDALIAARARAADRSRRLAGPAQTGTALEVSSATSNMSERDEHALASRVFVWRRSPRQALWQAGRHVKAHLRYRQQRARWRMV